MVTDVDTPYRLAVWLPCESCVVSLSVWTQGLNLLSISARNATFGTMSATQLREAPLHRDLVFVLDGLDSDVQTLTCIKLPRMVSESKFFIVTRQGKRRVIMGSIFPRQTLKFQNYQKLVSSSFFPSFHIKCFRFFQLFVECFGSGHRTPSNASVAYVESEGARTTAWHPLTIRGTKLAFF